MTLYELSAEYRSVLTAAYVAAEANDGEIPESLSDALDKIAALRDNKIEACIKIVRQLELESEAISSEASRLLKRSDQTMKQAKHLREWIANNMATGEKIKTPIASVSCRETEAVNIIGDVPQDDKYGAIKTSFYVSKTKIKEALSNGENLPFAQIIKNKSITIR